MSKPFRNSGKKTEANKMSAFNLSNDEAVQPEAPPVVMEEPVAVIDTSERFTVEEPDAALSLAVSEPVAVVEKVKPVVPEVKVVPKEEKKQSVKQPVKEEINMRSFVTSSMVTYYEGMKRGVAVNPEQGGKNQVSLFSVMQHIFNSANQLDFNKQWNEFLKFANEKKDDCFNDNLAYRFPQYWTGSDKDFSNFRRLMFIAIETADVATRKKKFNALNLTKALEDMSEDHKNKIVAFYS